MEIVILVISILSLLLVIGLYGRNEQQNISFINGSSFLDDEPMDDWLADDWDEEGTQSVNFVKDPKKVKAGKASMAGAKRGKNGRFAKRS